jgi:hypothetical protein
LRAVISEVITKFMWEDIICKHGIFERLFINGGPENKDLTKRFAVIYGIMRVIISAYNAKTNEMIKRGHKSVVNALAKITEGGIGKWIRNLHAVL